MSKVSVRYGHFFKRPPQSIKGPPFFLETSSFLATKLGLKCLHANSIKKITSYSKTSHNCAFITKEKYLQLWFKVVVFLDFVTFLTSNWRLQQNITVKWMQRCPFVSGVAKKKKKNNISMLWRMGIKTVLQQIDSWEITEFGSWDIWRTTPIWFLVVFCRKNCIYHPPADASLVLYYWKKKSEG